MTEQSAEWIARLRHDGYAVSRLPDLGPQAARVVLETARHLGEVYVPPGCDPEDTVLRTAPTRSRRAAPFDRPEQIGWHGDFASHADRPEASLVLITRSDPRGGEFGAWRLASVDRVLEELRHGAQGEEAIDLLSRTELPFAYADGEPPSWFRVIEERPGGRLGLRFYLPSIHRGCAAEYGEIPREVEAALSAVKHAADAVEEVVPTRSGSLLVASNWFALHDRARQTVSRSRPNREALLCFVADFHDGIG
jgi:hypothetical protein